jgi:hypothetical protein
VYFPGAAFLTAAVLAAGCAMLFARAMRFAPQRAPASAATPEA